ncbi:MAG TPA: Fe-S cluster assembly ATPase SufC [Thermoleophilaceae bacterium]|nr:Fe-S cluster assembly ATPase SufC [Thermoleophilaceae bacterium]
MSLEIQNLHVRIEEREILRGLNLSVSKGETHALMGPNGSGKSTLANTIMGNPAYEVTDGKIVFNGEDLTEADPDERARAGLFMAFQYPATIPGVSVANFLRMAVNAKREEPIKVKEFGKLLGENMELLRIDRQFTSRYLNEGFSGGEKKRAEILQLAMLKPEIAVLDETDSGLDIDALRIVSDGVNALSGPDMGSLIITHYTRILEYVKPDFVHIMLDGRIVREGGPELADELEEKGYDFIREEVAAADAG